MTIVTTSLKIDQNIVLPIATGGKSEEYMECANKYGCCRVHRYGECHMNWYDCFVQPLLGS